MQYNQLQQTIIDVSYDSFTIPQFSDEIVISIKEQHLSREIELFITSFMTNGRGWYLTPDRSILIVNKEKALSLNEVPSEAIKKLKIGLGFIFSVKNPSGQTKNYSFGVFKIEQSKEMKENSLKHGTKPRSQTRKQS